MENVILLIVCFLLVIVSSIITSLIRQLTVRMKLYDIPNDRSSHEVPTPRGGGVALVSILLVSISVLYYYGMIKADFSVSLLIGLSIIAVTGLIDDIKSLPVLIRAITYVFAAALSVLLIGGVPHLSINNYSFNLGYFGYVLSVIYLVWLTNLFNFMDGTDGFAAIQTICVAIFCGLLLSHSGNTSLAIILFCLVSSTTGFLFWNWPPAKIFMGDVGSCTLGFLFGLFSIYTEKNEIVSISVWLIVLSPFIGDATFTLIKRMVNGEKWYKSHNSHAYQKLFQLGVTHKQLAISLLIFNITIIWPLAYVANSYRSFEFIMIILTYSMIGAIWFVVQHKHNQSKEILS